MTRLRPIRDAAILGAIAGIPAAAFWAAGGMITFRPNLEPYITTGAIMGAIGLPFAWHAVGQAIFMVGVGLVCTTLYSGVIVAAISGDVPSLIPAAACEWSALSTVWRC